MSACRLLNTRMDHRLPLLFNPLKHGLIQCPFTVSFHVSEKATYWWNVALLCIELDPSFLYERPLGNDWPFKQYVHLSWSFISLHSILLVSGWLRLGGRMTCTPDLPTESESNFDGTFRYLETNSVYVIDYNASYTGTSMIWANFCDHSSSALRPRPGCLYNSQILRSKMKDIQVTWTKRHAILYTAPKSRSFPSFSLYRQTSLTWKTRLLF